MVRVYVPGVTGLAGLSLRVLVTTNGTSWVAGMVDTATRTVETAREVVPASQIRRICYAGPGTWLPAAEVRAVVILLSAIAGMPHRQLREMAELGTELEERKRQTARRLVQARWQKAKQREVPVGLVPIAGGEPKEDPKEDPDPALVGGE